jgi:hypothetical protein
MKKLSILMVVFLLLSTFVFAQSEAEAVVEEENPEIFFWGGLTGFGPYDNEAMPEAVAWVKDNFGFTPQLEGVPAGTAWIQGLNLKMAEGEMPDVIHLGWSMDVATRSVVNSLAAEGTIQPLTKYFDMPDEYPVLANFDKSLLKAYMYNGEIYAFPGWLSTVDTDAPPWPTPMWIVRKDLAIATDDDPVTSYTDMYDADRLYEVLKAAQGMTNANGDPVIPLGIQPADDLTYLTNLLKQIKGAGWEVSPKGNLIPFWASEEMHKSLAFMNNVWAEGMMDPGFWTLKVDEYKEVLQAAGYGMSVGWTWNVGQGRTALDAIVGEFGLDSDEAAAYREMMYVMAQFPTVEDDGSMSPITTAMMGPVVISSAINADGVMKYFEFIDTLEGTITSIVGAGVLGVDWEWVDGDQVWQMIGTDGSQKPADGPRGAAGHVTSTAAFDPENPPLIYPAMQFFTGQSYASYYPIVYAKTFQGYAEDKGWPVAELSGDGEYTCLETQHPEMWKPVVSGFPSYQLYTQDLEPLEVSMMTTMENRWKEGLAEVITSEDFEGAYTDFMASLISVGDLKSVYNKLQEQYEAWLAQNDDDRGDMGTGTVIPAWNEVMGW